jgi:hypothetical protein
MNTQPEPDAECPPLNPIRVETALSRYPVHRLAKKGEISIELREEDERGETTLQWRVTYNSGFGQPGPLAYKLDTLIVNRKIEEARRPIPRIICLGSLKEMAERLELGGDTNCVKKALRQNASAFIIAKVRYKLPDGTVQTLEADFTRYSVVFTGERLPDGEKADAVYLILNDIYMQVINGAMTRPLDYDYLKELPPLPQRFYELLSYPIYATLKYDRHRARLAYSEFCTYAPQTRYFDWEHARKQMAKVHAPHKRSGYIARAEFEPTTDGNGQPDWLMFYTPGPKARAEYRAFTGRGGPVMLEVERKPPGPESLGAEPMQPEFELPWRRKAATRPRPEREPGLPGLVTELIKREVTKTTAAELVQKYPAETIRAKLDVFDWLTEKRDKRVAKSPAGYLVKSIADDYAPPKGFVSKAERQRQEDARRAEERQAAADRRRQKEEEARECADKKAIAAYWESLTPEQQADLDVAANAAADPELMAMDDGPLKRIGQRLRRDGYIRQLLRNREQVPVEA